MNIQDIAVLHLREGDILVVTLEPPVLPTDVVEKMMADIEARVREVLVRSGYANDVIVKTTEANFSILRGRDG